MSSDAHRPLLAKSLKIGKGRRREITLLRHTRDVVESAEALFGIPDRPTRLGRCWARFFGVSDLRTMLDHLRAACALHDLGKANSTFDRLMYGECVEQVLRHEHFVALALADTELGRWIASRAELDVPVLIAAVLGHHLKAKSDEVDVGPGIPPDRGERLLTNHPEFAELLTYIGEVCSLPDSSPSVPTKWSRATVSSAAAQSIPRSLKRLSLTLAQLGEGIDEAAGETRRRLLWAVRAGLIVADAAGSALPRTDKSVSEWILRTFPEEGESLLTAERIAQAVVSPRLDYLKSIGKSFEWSEFQKAAGELPSRGLLLAPCGSGKTLAAWKWLQGQAARRPFRHAIFLSPTRATATEGFRDYVSWAPEAEATLMSGSAAYEIEELAETFDEDDARRTKDFRTEEALFAIGFWDRQYFQATVDQFFNFTAWSYKSICLLPVLADAAVVIDEVHSFDAKMFRALLDFLDHFDCPVLCMTATMPPSRRSKLIDRNLTDLDAYAEDFQDLRSVDSVPRYHVRRTNRTESVEAVRNAASDGRRVLWVVNTVKRAQAALREIAAPGEDDIWRTPDGLPVRCYHSRFRLQDRKSRHDEVVRAFRPNAEPSIAITTQVCEMGLDLDADLLVTELCPASSLVQRFGRCNRAHRPRSGAGEILVYDGESPHPYEREELAAAAAFLDRISERAISQATVNEEFLESEKDRYDPARSACSFIGMGVYAASGEDAFREIEEFTTQSILDDDLQKARDLAKSRTPLDGLIVPVPRRLDGLRPAPEPLPPFLQLAPAWRYDPQVGYDADASPDDRPPAKETAWIL